MTPRTALVLVDFDDTLVDTAPRFQRARSALFELLAGAGFAEELSRRVHHDEVDPEMLDLHGLGPFRLEPSFRETYFRLCALHGAEPDPALAEACAALARDVAGPPAPLAGALDALRELAAALPTVLYTQAENAAYQLECVRAVGVLEILPPERVRIPRRKSAEDLRATLAEFGVPRPELACLVGNSIRSDINPALAVGMRAILVEVAEPWEFDRVDPIADGFPRVPSFRHAVDLLLGRAPVGAQDAAPEERAS